MRSIGPIMLLAAGALRLSAQPPASLDPFAGVERLDRAALVGAVLALNPSLEAARQSLAAAAERPRRAAALDDAMASWALAPHSLGAAGVSFGYELELSQALPYPGKRRQRRAVAAAELEATAAELSAVHITLATQAASLFSDLYLAHRALESNAEHASLVRDLLRAATARYAAGLTGRHEPLLAESELAHLQHDALVLANNRVLLVARINALLDRAPLLPLPPPPAELPVAADQALDFSRLESEALLQRPELRANEAALRARRAEHALARLGGRPDFGVAASYNSMWTDDEHRWAIGGTASLPLWRRRVAASLAEADALRRQAEQEGLALAREARRAVFEAGTRWREARHLIDLYDSRLLPAARDQAQAALAGWRSGGNDLGTVIEAERNLRRVALLRHQAIAELDRRGAQLDAVLGRVPGERAAGGEP